MNPCKHVEFDSVGSSVIHSLPIFHYLLTTILPHLCRTIRPDHKYGYFLKKGPTPRVITSMDRHFLSGWKPATLAGYNCAVKKFLTFKKLTGNQFTGLPISPVELEGFVFWAGKSAVWDASEHELSSKSIKNIPGGLRTQDRPTHQNLRESRRDAATTATEAPHHAAAHTLPPETLSTGTAQERAILDLAVVAFWGMARVGELTYPSAEAPRPGAVLSSDAGRLIMISQAKTACPGELQLIVLNSQPGALCPVRAVERRLADCSASPEAACLFSCSGLEMVVVYSYSREIAVHGSACKYIFLGSDQVLSKGN
ncbi:uncharacterized protein VP01_636g6 [Puccinia sorghi]|uniref:Uncharacterized protein n=1 Tax=Puccinia sorghi TaxID=27349 RepID=A0A0L6UGV7_9BASI|nr:uncharacterized protein VP01_636g6 [Puccinia sorghi]